MSIGSATENSVAQSGTPIELGSRDGTTDAHTSLSARLETQGRDRSTYAQGMSVWFTSDVPISLTKIITFTGSEAPAESVEQTSASASEEWYAPSNSGSDEPKVSLKGAKVFEPAHSKVVGGRGELQRRKYLGILVWEDPDDRIYGRKYLLIGIPYTNREGAVFMTLSINWHTALCRSGKVFTDHQRARGSFYYMWNLDKTETALELWVKWRPDKTRDRIDKLWQKKKYCRKILRLEMTAEDMNLGIPSERFELDGMAWGTSSAEAIRANFGVGL